MEQNWLVEEGFLAVERRPSVSRRNHLARRFVVMGFVRIPERRSSEMPEKCDEHQNCGEDGHCRPAGACPQDTSSIEGV